VSALYRDMVFGVQALRRRVERDALALGGALGAALRLLPHQIANAARVLTDLEVRHLLADEVGLGKTAQAVMILNALRLQREGLRAAVLVPDALAVQWRDELRSRGHVAPVDGMDGEAADCLRLLWPEILRSEELDLASFDLLIVDEPQQLTDTLQRQIAAAAREVESVLVLTATPPFRRPAEMRRILRMIEPSRISGDEEDPFGALRARECAAAEALRSGSWGEELGGAPPPDSAEACAAAAHSAARRIIRTRRSQWSRFLPRREPRVYEIEPTACERERQRLMWSYFGYLGELSRDFGLDLLAQRVLRGPASLRQRVTYLRGHGHERGGLLARVHELLGPQYGDSRFDALLDILCAIWAEDPQQRVLIAAGDNLTVDDLAKRLPKLFDAGPAGPLAVETLRNQTRGPDSLAATDDVFAGAVGAFQRGEARALIAAEVGSYGLNLQHARHIILYSIPWDPSDVEQWIGRVDRIGNTALVQRGGELTPIEVHVPAQRGLVDQRVVEVLRATGILERSVSLDADAVHAAREAILQAALSNDQGVWSGALAAAAAVGEKGELEDLGLPLLAASPWAPARAAEIGSALERAEPSAPVLGGSPEPGTEGRERALRDWLRAMGAAGEYELRKIRGPSRVRSLGYPVLARRAKHIDEAARVPLDEEVIQWDRRPFVYYRAERKRLEQPPLIHYAPADSAPELLYFLDHGSRLHEALVDAWVERLLEIKGQGCKLRIPQGHALHGRPPCAVLARVAVLHPDRLLPKSQGAPPHLREADIRFLRAHLPARVLFAAVSVSAGGFEPLDEPSALALLAPPPDSPLLLPTGAEEWGKRGLSPEAEQRAGEIADRRIQEAAAAAWSPRAPSLQAAIQRRLYAIRADLADREWLAAQELGGPQSGTERRQRRRREDVEAEVAATRAATSARLAALERVTGEHRQAVRTCGSVWILLESDP
jgi:ATP-dependent helicase HepA